LPTFEPHSTIAVPFPYVERDTTKRRPALVVSQPRLVSELGLLWVLMITSAAHPAWPDDIAIDDLGLAGLAKLSVIRPTKIATVEAARAQPIGRVTTDVAARVRAALTGLLAGMGHRAADLAPGGHMVSFYRQYEQVLE
jgi:mRNA interferase MazF